MSDDPAGAQAPKPWAVYLLHCAGGKSYIGISPSPVERFAAHQSGKGAAFTRANRPQTLAALVWFEHRSAAASMEVRLKALPRPEKLAWFARSTGWQQTNPAPLAAGIASLADRLSRPRYKAWSTELREKLKPTT
jgi:putative endonuclease